MGGYTDYWSTAPGTVLTQSQHELYARVRQFAGQDGSDCVDVLRGLRAVRGLSLYDCRAVADALGGPGCGEQDFPC